MRQVVEKGGGLSPAERVQFRVRYLSDGAELGTRSFVEEIFEKHREQFGLKRKSGARPMKSGDWGGLFRAGEENGSVRAAVSMIANFMICCNLHALATNKCEISGLNGRFLSRAGSCASSRPGQEWEVDEPIVKWGDAVGVGQPDRFLFGAL